MRKDTRVISMNEITNDVCKRGIQRYDSAIRTYIQELNKFLPYDFELNTEDMIFEIVVRKSEDGSFLDDGNTYCPGNNYSVLWAFKIFPPDQMSFTANGIRGGYVRDILTFELKFEERIFDGKTSSKFFNSTIVSSVFDRENAESKHRVFSINNNYKDGVANKDSMAYTIILLKEMIDRYRLKQSLEALDFSTMQFEDSIFSY
jgi:hypothetical protein